MTSRDPTNRLSLLTSRQRRILRLRCEGAELLDIAGDLHISHALLKKEVGRIYIKLGLDRYTKVERYKALFETYCPALDTHFSSSDEESEEDEGPLEDEPDDEPVPESVERMVDEDVGIVAWRRGEILPPEPQRQPRRGWRSFLFGIALTAVVILAVIAVGRLSGAWQPDTIVVTATGPSPETAVPGVQLREVTRQVEVTREVQVFVEVTSTPDPSDPTAAPVAQQEQPTPEPTVIVVTATPAPTVTPRPIEVALPFEDNFDQGPKEEWEVLQGTWRMVDGAYGTDERFEWSYVVMGDPGWQDYSIEVDVAGRGLGTTKAIAFLVRTKDLNTGMRFYIDPWSAWWALHQDGTAREIAKSEGRLPYGMTNKWVISRLKVEVEGTIYSVYLNGQLISRIQDDTFASGRVGLATYRSSDEVRFDNFLVTAID